MRGFNVYAKLSFKFLQRHIFVFIPSLEILSDPILKSNAENPN